LGGLLDPPPSIANALTPIIETPAITTADIKPRIIFPFTFMVLTV